MESFYILILKEFFTNIFGIHYPKDIVALIMMALSNKFKISCGCCYSTLISGPNEIPPRDEPERDYPAGEIYVWGSSEAGRLGLGDNKDRIRPTKLDLLDLYDNKRIKLISCGWDFTITLVSIFSANSQIMDKLYVWGNNSDAELGLGDNISRFSPTELNVEFDSKIKSINCGASHTIILLESGKCYGWGSNMRRQVGLDNFSVIPSPQKIDILSQVSLVKCGEHHNIALTKSRYKCYVWGSNLSGQLGLGPGIVRSLPQELTLLDEIISIYCGGSHTIALTKIKTYVWGCNSNGQLGLGDMVYKYLPQELTLLTGIVSISCGSMHTIALTSAGRLYSWGSNDDGQLGLGDNIDRVVPSEIYFSCAIKFESIHCGAYHTIVVTTHNKIYIWGRNTSGQLGLGDRHNRCSPQELCLS